MIDSQQTNCCSELTQMLSLKFHNGKFVVREVQLMPQHFDYSIDESRVSTGWALELCCESWSSTVDPFCYIRTTSSLMMYSMAFLEGACACAAFWCAKPPAIAVRSDTRIQSRYYLLAATSIEILLTRVYLSTLCSRSTSKSVSIKLQNQPGIHMCRQ